MRIVDAKARIVLNSRGDPAIEVEINGFSESVPSGASKGSYEANKIDVEEAIKLFNSELVDLLKTYDIQTLGDLKNFENDLELIGGIKKYGSNLILAIEYAILRAWSFHYNEPIYSFFNKKPNIKNIRILANVVGGGAHAKWRSTTVQEYLISPRINDLRVAIFLASYYHKLLGERLELLDEKFMYGKNDEGAWTTSLKTHTLLNVLRNLSESLEKEYSIKIDIGIDLAATHIFNNGVYVFENKKYSKEEFIRTVLDIIEDYNLFYIEDPLHEDDFEGFSEINKETRAIVAGDDLTVTNIERIEKAIKQNSIKAVIIKPDQAGSIIRTIEAIEFCKKNDIIPIFSHRSGETESNIIAHLAVAFEVPYVKFGIIGGERISKLNELLRIYEKIGS
ncbi:MAG: enolase C-terminal domain-like protein [Candidatus Aenigmatarchaeota archaeon]